MQRNNDIFILLISAAFLALMAFASHALSTSFWPPMTYALDDHTTGELVTMPVNLTVSRIYNDQAGLDVQSGLVQYQPSCEDLVPQLAAEFTSIIGECNQIIDQLDDSVNLLLEKHEEEMDEAQDKVMSTEAKLVNKQILIEKIESEIREKEESLRE